MVCSDKNDGDLTFTFPSVIHWLASPRSTIVAYNKGNKGVSCSDVTYQSEFYTTQRPAHLNIRC